MKVVIIILVLIVIGFAAAIGVAVYRATTPPAPPSAHGPPTKSNGEIDDDALANWEPPPMAAVMGKLSRPFAPKLFKKAVNVSAEAGSEGTQPIPSADKGMRIARLRLITGRGAIVTYRCEESDDDDRQGETCPQVACLCPENTVLEEDDVKDCEEAWRNARASGDDKFVCREKDDDVSAVIYRDGGVIVVAPMGEQAAQVSIR
ncbi:hypothetical protein ASD38_05490 [Caulobacter sp. Root487D2Y]|uniref:hypothetical protein n=1 Tax=Caulobacter sp. Root487D2Y TaxID=1736547 RepID=UPI0006F246CC|nr:hypothetical protein [Caulobacter sp. Root487D2Y]KQY30823.1 hypothetical protein ASD38_05490 [Caulobacter sp. Root487D2Y]